jgi:HAD superfamily hydrolase (TIGR01490 family)
MRLALFDLDHTLIPFDSGMLWIRFLAGRGHLPAHAEAEYVDHCLQYVAGRIDINAVHRILIRPLAQVDTATLAAWQIDFQAAMAPHIPAAMQRLVAAHHEAGDLCAIVTATSRIVAEPFAALFGVEHLLCTEPARALHPSGELRPTGEIAGVPCVRAYKIDHVENWLRRQRLPSIAAAESCHFYSDSISDLPLLQAVSHPVAVRPDERLRAHATERGWLIVDGF